MSTAYIGWFNKETLNESGLSFDYAIPQDVWDAIYAATKENPAGHIVWMYPKGSMFGGPIPVTSMGAIILRKWIESEAIKNVGDEIDRVFDRLTHVE